MKKSLLFLACASIMALTACGSNTNTTTTAAETTATEAASSEQTSAETTAEAAM